MIDIPTAITLYALVGLFLAGVSLAHDGGSLGFTLCLFLWPILIATIAIIVVVAAPIAFGHWVGEHVKGWF